MSSSPSPSPVPVAHPGGLAAVLFFSLMMLLAVGAAAWIDAPWAVALPVAVILAYAAVRYALEPRHAEGVAGLADQVYFLSYLGTLGAIGVLAILLSRDPEALQDRRSVGLLASVAVWGSVAGVVLLKALKAHAWRLGGAPAGSERLEGALTHLAEVVDKTPWREVVGKALEDVLRVPPAMTELRQASRAAEEEVARLRRQVEALARAVDHLGSAVRQGHRDVAEFRESVGQVRQVLDEFVRLTQARLDQRVWE
jgi:hypothetical protein